jgi:hypothetical protein
MLVCGQLSRAPRGLQIPRAGFVRRSRGNPDFNPRCTRRLASENARQNVRRWLFYRGLSRYNYLRITEMDLAGYFDDDERREPGTALPMRHLTQ